jgi:hypothetical protein
MQRFSDSIRRILRAFSRERGAMNAARRGKTNFAGAKQHSSMLDPELNLKLTKIDFVESLTPRFKIELPKGIECCCLFDGSIVRTVYLSPRQAGRRTLSRKAKITDKTPRFGKGTEARTIFAPYPQRMTRP